MANDRLTDKDISLIEEARKVRPCHWGQIFDELIPQADTEQARRKLKSIACTKYHHDEYLSGIL